MLLNSNFCLELASRAWQSALASMSTSALALAGGLLYPVADLFVEFKENGWHGMTRHWRERFKYSALIAAAWWCCLFSYHLLYKVPSEIRTQANSVIVPQLSYTPAVPSFWMTKRQQQNENFTQSDIAKSLEQLTVQFEQLKSSSNPRPWIYVTDAWMEDQNNHHFFHLVITNKGTRPAYHLDYKHEDEIGTSRLRGPASDGFEFDKERSSNGYFSSHLDTLAPGDTSTFGYGPETIDMTLNQLKPDAHKTIRRVGQLMYSDTPDEAKSSRWGKDYGLLKFCFEIFPLNEQERITVKGPSIVLSLCTEKGTNISK